MPVTRRTFTNAGSVTLHDDDSGPIVCLTINDVRYTNTSALRSRLQVGVHLDPRSARELHELLGGFLAGDDDADGGA